MINPYSLFKFNFFILNTSIYSNSYVKHFAATGGQSCVDMVDVQQQGNDTLHANNHVVIPMSNTSCSGGITGLMMSLSEQNGSDYFKLEVWSPKKLSSEVYEMKAEYALTEHDITNNSNNSNNSIESYHFGNVSFAKNETIKFENGSFIVIYLPPNPRYTVWSINTTGYSYYTGNESIPSINFTTALKLYHMINNSQPLIQVVFGKFS